jgi:hypothetical protein
VPSMAVPKQAIDLPIRGYRPDFRSRIGRVNVSTGFVVKADLGSGLTAFIKRRVGPYSLGPREQATVFADRNAARASILQLPKDIRDSAQFSIHSAIDSSD